ncbi:MAG: hypothetical protein BJ554DRAFT_248 [Olpidium bornovanus]|uniref:Uncharacterized protein n=1 Tax=Olpidium bornovanus TaxID=278681 RepID=A0A8H7ZU18_9FUNG|nr:MAG: hypothetical protein BJ554DRAFT_248 [Olpidium bornovanus]
MLLSRPVATTLEGWGRGWNGNRQQGRRRRHRRHRRPRRQRSARRHRPLTRPPWACACRRRSRRRLQTAAALPPPRPNAALAAARRAGGRAASFPAGDVGRRHVRGRGGLADEAAATPTLEGAGGRGGSPPGTPGLPTPGRAAAGAPGDAGRARGVGSAPDAALRSAPDPPSAPAGARRAAPEPPPPPTRRSIRTYLLGLFAAPRSAPPPAGPPARAARGPAEDHAAPVTRRGRRPSPQTPPDVDADPPLDADRRKAADSPAEPVFGPVPNASVDPPALPNATAGRPAPPNALAGRPARPSFPFFSSSSVGSSKASAPADAATRVQSSVEVNKRTNPGSEFAYGEITPLRFAAIAAARRKASFPPVAAESRGSAVPPRASRENLASGLSSVNLCEEVEDSVLAAAKPPLFDVKTLQQPPRAFLSSSLPGGRTNAPRASHSFPPPAVRNGVGLDSLGCLRNRTVHNHVLVSAIIDDLPPIKLNGREEEVEPVVTPEIANLVSSRRALLSTQSPVVYRGYRRLKPRHATSCPPRVHLTRALAGETTSSWHLDPSLFARSAWHQFLDYVQRGARQGAASSGHQRFQKPDSAVLRWRDVRLFIFRRLLTLETVSLYRCSAHFYQSRLSRIRVTTAPVNGTL